MAFYLRFSLLVAVLFCLSPHVSGAKQLTIKPGETDIIIYPNESEPVKRALQDLLRDFEKVTNQKPLVKTSSAVKKKKKTEIVIINESNKNFQPDETKLKRLDGFESHRIYVDDKNQRIYLHGKDIRGTIYAIYSFSEIFLGVPPLWYFSSWKPEKKEILQIPGGYDYVVKSPQVRFRAWFPNGMDLVRPWKARSTANDDSILEAMLRLKLNCMEIETSIYGKDISSYAKKLTAFGLIITSHHHTPLNNSFGGYNRYWEKLKNQSPPELLLSNEEKLIEFWRHNVTVVNNSKIENLWLISFRGDGDKPFWETFKDAPESELERAEIINKMLNIQYNLIKDITKNPNPFVRLTFYDELSDLLAKGYLKPPVGENVIWTFVSGRRDHYPYDDLVAFDPKTRIKMGYYMNLHFTSTGSQKVAGEGPWKMEFNYRYAHAKSPLFFSVVNVGNVREFVMEMSANAAMMWNLDTYNSDRFMQDYCKIYFGEKYADDIARLYKDYYYAYWEQKKSDFPGGMERQYIFHDLRYSRVLIQLFKDFFKYNPSPLREIGYESIKGRSFRIEQKDNQVDAILEGMQKTIPEFSNVAHACAEMKHKLPVDKQVFFHDNLQAPANFMLHLSHCVYHFMYAYKNQQNKTVCIENLEKSLEYIKMAKNNLYETQHGVFEGWYDADALPGGIFRFDFIIKEIEKLIQLSMQKH